MPKILFFEALQRTLLYITAFLLLALGAFDFKAHAQEPESKNPCIRDLKHVSSQAHLWPGKSRRSSNKGWMLHKFLKPHSFLEKIGLLIGDIILEVNGIKADPTDPHDPAVAELYRLDGNKPNKIKIERDGQTESVIYTCPY